MDQRELCDKMVALMERGFTQREIEKLFNRTHGFIPHFFKKYGIEWDRTEHLGFTIMKKLEDYDNPRDRLKRDYLEADVWIPNDNGGRVQVMKAGKPIGRKGEEWWNKKIEAADNWREEEEEVE